MRRKSPFLFVIMIAILFMQLPLHHVAAEEFNYYDHSANHTYPNEWLEELITIHSFDDQYDEEAVQQAIDRLDAIPVNIVSESVKNGAELKMIDFEIPQLEGFTDLDGEQPRGHPDYITWNDMFGIARGNTGVSTIGYTFPRDYQGSEQLDVHEYFHVVDSSLLGKPITDLDEFITIHEMEQYDFIPGNDYYEYIEEFFAEVAAYYYRSDAFRDQLKVRTPQAYEFMDSLSSRLITIDEISETGIALSWQVNDQAATYSIYRDGELLDQTTEGSYTDKSFQSYMEHVYTIVAEDEASEQIMESLPRYVWTQENLSLLLDDLNIVRVVEETEKQITIEWDDIPNVYYYEIYRDGRFIGESNWTYYEDFVYASDTEFEYVVRAVSLMDEYVDLEPVLARTKKESQSENDDPWDVGLLENPSDDPAQADDISPKFILMVALIIVLIVILGLVGVIGFIIFYIVRSKKKKAKEDTE